MKNKKEEKWWLALFKAHVFSSGFDAGAGAGIAAGAVGLGSDLKVSTNLTSVRSDRNFWMSVAMPRL